MNKDPQAINGSCLSDLADETFITNINGNNQGKVMIEVNNIHKKFKEVNALEGLSFTAKDGEIIVQGDFKEKIYQILLEENYKVKKSG